MKIAIHGRTFNESARPFVESLFNELSRKGIQVQLSRSLRTFLDENHIAHHATLVYEKPADLYDANWVMSMGGDGTLLETISHIGAREIPTIGVNMGRLGFLATVSPDKISEMLNVVVRGDYKIDERTLVELESNSNLFDGLNFGLNDFTITKTDTSSMITVHTYLNGEFLNSYWADGLIVSTPTGSTGYSLSCGGPVLVPHSQNFIITPISPHNLNVRPLVVEDNSVIKLEVKSRSSNFLVSLDARSTIVDEHTHLMIRKAKFKAHLIKMQDDSFLNTLRSKLSWGLDMRN
jgi:NAD+ kinase